MKLLLFAPREGSPPFLDFWQGLDNKMRSKLLTLFHLLITTPPGLLHEPYVKHFTIEKYSGLFELRAKSKSLVRIVFTVHPEGVLLLTPFIKHHTRNTMQALDTSLRLLADLHDGSGSVLELPINKLLEGMK